MYVELYNIPKVHRLITLAAPHGGFYCKHFKCPLPIGFFTGFIENHVYDDWAQDLIAPANYWRSPLQDETFKEKSRALSIIDNYKKYNETYKNNFAGLEYFVMVGCEKDGMITPWQSQFFGFFEIGSEAHIQEMRDRQIYKDDLIGLK